MDDASILQTAYEKYDNVILSIVTIEELDNLKTNRDTIKAKKARRALDKILNMGKRIKYDLGRDVIEPLSSLSYSGIYNPNDDIILSCAIRNNADISTKDVAFRIKAESLEIQFAELYSNFDSYSGYKEVNLSDEEMAGLYSNPSYNSFECVTNQYLIVNDINGENVDIVKWDGHRYSPIHNKNVKTLAFGDKIKAKDVYQRAVIDSIMTNTMTAISGVAGTGKNRIVILNNPTKARGATDLGYYSGNMTEKLMQNSIGNILNTKFGDRFAVDLLIQQDKLRIISMADARGMEIRDDEILYITECQNTSVDLLKLSLSRASQGAKIIIEGDIYSQVDSSEFVGSDNGMRRAIDVFKGSDLFGFIELKNVWRSRIAEMVEKM